MWDFRGCLDGSNLIIYFFKRAPFIAQSERDVMIEQGHIDATENKSSLLLALKMDKGNMDGF